ncbi:hypothetical protein GGS21DRAFT_418469 [Xylaria nigripes]|nr:hypothetical protein GGS21DRAFT_418469 [Xylaria nigripes]
MNRLLQHKRQQSTAPCASCPGRNGLVNGDVLMSSIPRRCRSSTDVSTLIMYRTSREPTNELTSDTTGHRSQSERWVKVGMRKACRVVNSIENGTLRAKKSFHFSPFFSAGVLMLTGPAITLFEAMGNVRVLDLFISMFCSIPYCPGQHLFRGRCLKFADLAPRYLFLLAAFGARTRVREDFGLCAVGGALICVSSRRLFEGGMDWAAFAGL